MSKTINQTAALPRVDAEQRRRREQTLPSEQENVQAMFDAVEVGLLLIDRNGVVIRANDAAARLLGEETGKLRGHRAGSILGCIQAAGQPEACGHREECRSCQLRRTLETVLHTAEAGGQREIEHRPPSRAGAGSR